MSKVVFKPNHAGIAALAVSPEVTALVLGYAERAKAVAESLAAEFADTGEYASSFEVTSDVVSITTRYPTKRAAGTLTNTSPHASAVEWGNKNDHKAHRVLRRALEAMTSG